MEEENFSPDEAEKLRAGLDELPVEQREVLTLRFIEEMSYEQIAEVIGRPVGTVRSRIHYAKLAAPRKTRIDDPQKGNINMSEKEFAKALLQGEDPIDLQLLTERVLRRDRRRIWVHGTVCILAWMLVVMLPWATILPMVALVGEYQADLMRSVTPATAQQSERLLHVLKMVKGGTLATLVGSFGSMFLAAACTVSLIVLSRRATLRQVNARLAEISSQLKLLTKDPK